MGNILIIDDDVQIGHLLESHLRDEGHQVTIALRGDLGMAEVQKAIPDLIILDVMLPDATGYQICSRLRQMTGLQEVPIIMVSGVARYPNQKMYAMERGANEYLVKPLAVIELGEMVHSYLRKDFPVSVKTTMTKDRLAEKAAEAAVPTPTAPNPALDQDGLLELRTYLKQAIQKEKKGI